MAAAGKAPTPEGVRVLAVILLFAATALYGASGKSATFDEHVHITGGYSYWSQNDYRLHPENGTLAQRWLALPLAIKGANFFAPDDRTWQSANEWTVSDRFIYDLDNDPGAMLWSARLMAIVVTAALAFLVYAWSRRLFGTAGAWVSLALFACSPTFLAHGPLATSDMTTAFCFVAATWALWNAMHGPGIKSALLSMLAVSALIMTKQSALFVIPVALVMLIARVALRRPPAREAARLGALALGHVVAVVILLWASFGFRYSAFGPNARPGAGFMEPWDQLNDSSVVWRAVDASRKAKLLPEAYLFGLATVNAYGERKVSFLNGEVRPGGRPAFFPYAALVKTTLPMLLLVAALPVLLVLRRRRESLYHLTPLIALVGVYWVLAIGSGINIGLRHLMPAIAAMTILLGAAGEPVERLLAARRSGQRLVLSGAVVLVLLAWHALEAVRIAPNYLAYFNPLAGGPDNGYKHLVDSSLDWGQDLPGLSAWLDANQLKDQTKTPVYLSYFGSARPEYYGVDAVPLPSYLDRMTARVPVGLHPGVYAISATMLQGVYLGAASGAWTDDLEKQYRNASFTVNVFLSAPSDAAKRALIARSGEAAWIDAFKSYERLRFARLASHLRRRNPDANIGHSILIYRVGVEELSDAINF